MISTLTLISLFYLGSPSEEPIRIMPLGDSITEAFRGTASYRYWLWKKLIAAAYKVDFVGSMTGAYRGDTKFQDFDGDHEGHWGWRVDQVLPKLDGWLNKAKPNIVLCHLGTNDLNEPIPQIRDELSQLIDKLRANNPEITILLAQLIPAREYAKVAHINEAIAKLAKTKHTAKSNIVLVDHYTNFTAKNHTYDGVHPNEAGEQIMAERWFQALKLVLPKGD